MLQTERAGVIASFILNAAMIPGWPPPRTIEAAESEAALKQMLSGDLQPDELEILTYLQNFGLNRGLLGKLFAMMERLRRRRALLLALAMLLTGAKTVLQAIKEELEHLGQAEEAAEAALAGAGGRHRLVLK